MGRKRAAATEAAPASSEQGTSKYSAVKSLVEANPNISRSEVVTQLKAKGIDVNLDMASSYASKARGELGSAPKRKRKGGRPKKVAALAVTVPTVRQTKPASTGGMSPDDVIGLANLVKRFGGDAVVRLVHAIS